MFVCGRRENAVDAKVPLGRCEVLSLRRRWRWRWFLRSASRGSPQPRGSNLEVQTARNKVMLRRCRGRRNIQHNDLTTTTTNNSIKDSFNALEQEQLLVQPCRCRCRACPCTTHPQQHDNQLFRPVSCTRDLRGSLPACPGPVAACQTRWQEPITALCSVLRD